ncbi:MAG: hypothetical protein ABH860_00575, partial [bacterium]
KDPATLKLKRDPLDMAEEDLLDFSRDVILGFTKEGSRLLRNFLSGLTNEQLASVIPKLEKDLLKKVIHGLRPE